MKISDYLSHGQTNAVSMRSLCNMTGISERELRRMITAERMRGTPILSDTSTGYFLSASKEETARFVKSMRHRAIEILRAADAVEEAN